MSERRVVAAGDDQPRYRRLAQELRERIATGALRPGAALPSERDLCVETGLSRVTVRSAIDLLIDEGLLTRRQGAGTFVVTRIEATGSSLSGFSDDARARGDDPGVIWIMRSHGLPTDEEAAALGITPRTKVARLSRVRLSGGEPLAIEHAVVPAALLPDLQALGDSLYAALNASGARPVAGKQRIRAALATPTEAGILGIREGAEVLRIERTAHDRNGRTVEFTRSAYRGDRYDFISDLRSPQD